MVVPNYQNLVDVVTNLHIAQSPEYLPKKRHYSMELGTDQPAFYAIVANVSTISSGPATDSQTLLCDQQAVAVSLRHWEASQIQCDSFKDYSLDFEHAYMTTYLAS